MAKLMKQVEGFEIAEGERPRKKMLMRKLRKFAQEFGRKISEVRC